MRKGLYFVVDTLDFNNPGGIEKKIEDQIKLYESVGIKMSMLPLKKSLYKGKETYWNINNIPSNISDFDILYFRKCTVIDMFFLSFFKKIKSMAPHVKVAMELPSFPYDGEFAKGIHGKIALAIDRIYRKKIAGVIDLLAITGKGESEVWGIKAVYFNNGIDVSRIVKKKNPYHKFGEEIVISCVAQFSPWHGYERLLKGLNEYYIKGGRQKIKVLMVGEGEEVKKYQELSRTLLLTDCVEFIGKKTTTELDDIFDMTDIGCCSLGRYKTNNYLSGELKSREYMGRGILMITGCDIDILCNKDYPYYCPYPNDSSFIDIEKLLSFYSVVEKYGDNELQSIIQNMAIDIIDFSKNYAPVLNAITRMLMEEPV